MCRPLLTPAPLPGSGPLSHNGHCSPPPPTRGHPSKCPGGGGAAPPNLHSSSSREWGNLKMSLGSFLSENPAQPRLSAPQGSPGQGLTRHPCTQGAPSAGGGTHRARREEDPGVWSPTDPPLCRGPGLPPPLLAWSAQDQPLQPCTLGKALEKVAGSRYTPEGSQPPPPRTDCDPLSPLPALQLWLMAPVWGGNPSYPV